MKFAGPKTAMFIIRTSDDGINWPVGLGQPVPDQKGGPYIFSLKNGNLLVTSNSGNISVSDDYGSHWSKTESAWHQHFGETCIKQERMKLGQ
jgi:hypothetical protein